MFRKTQLAKSSYLALCFSSFTCKNDFSKQPYNINTCVATLQSCAQRNNLSRGKEVHSFMLKNGLMSSPFCITSLINMYSKCNQPDNALNVFSNPSVDPNVYAYNAIITCFIMHGQADRGIQFYRKMRESGIPPDKFTFPCLIKGLSDILNVSEAKKIHALVFKLELNLDIFVASALVNCYLKFGLMEEAELLFNRLPAKDVVLWNSMVNGYAQISQFDKALMVFREMCRIGVNPSSFTVTGMLSVFAEMGDFQNGRAIHGLLVKFGYESSTAVCNALIDMYGKCKSVGDSSEIFEMIEKKDIYSWNSMISANEQCGVYDATLRLFYKMFHAGIKPDLVTATSVLSACSNLAALMHGRQIHGYMIVNCHGIEDVLVDNAIMDMYAKCGSMADAHALFRTMKRKDVASWNIMITGYGMHGYANEALEIFQKMVQSKFNPDMITFVGVLSACSHAGLVRQGREFLTTMETNYGVVPSVEHYTCVIDMLGRANQTQEAYEIAVTMPMEANPVVWRALLSACQLHGNMNIAEVASRKVMELQPGHSGSYVLMSNAYVAAGRYEDVADVRYLMAQKKLRKIPGCSWIELRDGVHAFINSDKAHPETDSIRAVLLLLTAGARVFEQGYVPGF